MTENTLPPHEEHDQFKEDEADAREELEAMEVSPLRMFASAVTFTYDDFLSERVRR